MLIAFEQNRKQNWGTFHYQNPYIYIVQDKHKLNLSWQHPNNTQRSKESYGIMNKEKVYRIH